MKRTKKDFYIDWGMTIGFIVLVVFLIDRGYI